jgi:NYN domain
MDLSIPISNQTRHRVAILVDGDNFPYTSLSTLETNVARYGDVAIRRVFGDMALQKGWAGQTAYIATHCTTSAGKNRADMALVVAAMDFAHRGLATAFIIVSDDRDFGPLVTYLCEQGYRVDWVGKPKKMPEAKVPQAASKVAHSKDPLVLKVRKIIADHGKEGIPIQALGPAGQKEGIKISATPQKTWRAWLLAHGVDFVCDPRGPEARVRLKT